MHGTYAVGANKISCFACTLQVPTREEELLSVYQVVVRTSDISGAGTDSDVLLSLFGEKDGKVRNLGLCLQCVVLFLSVLSVSIRL